MAQMTTMVSGLSILYGVVLGYGFDIGEILWPRCVNEGRVVEDWRTIYMEEGGVARRRSQAKGETVFRCRIYNLEERVGGSWLISNGGNTVDL